MMELPVPEFSQDGLGWDRKKSGTNGEFKDDNWARNTVWESAAAILKYLSDFLGTDLFSDFHESFKIKSLTIF